MTFKTMSDVRAANSQLNNHWFERETMQFFNTRIESGLIAGRYFVTSERRDETFPRLYSVRQALPDGRIETVGQFQAHASKDAARAAIARLLEAGQ